MEQGAQAGLRAGREMVLMEFEYFTIRRGAVITGSQRETSRSHSISP